MLVFRLLKENIHFRALAIVILAGKVNSKYCDGGHACSPPKECCTLGCCYLYAPSGYRPTVSQGAPNSSNLLNLVVWNHWVFWCLLLLFFLSCMGGCGLWRRRQLFPHRWCCRDSRSDEERSEPDSAGSCYPPPHYSRCSSFHHAPPPYTEVTSKPDLYPLVISYGAENGKIGDNYLMVQYFRNYIVRPALGSLSAESTADSISSSFLCQSANENDSNIPPPYEDSRQDERDDIELQSLTRSASSVSHNGRILTQVQPQLLNNNRRSSCTITIGNNERTQTAELQQIVAENIHQSIHKASAAVSGAQRLQSMLPTTLHTFRAFPNSFPANNLYSEPTMNHQSNDRISNEYLTTFKRPPNRSVILSTSVDSIHERNGYPTHQYTSDVILAQPQSYCDPNNELHYYSTDIINNPNRLLKYINDSFSSEDNLSQARGSIQDFVSSDGLSHSHLSNLEINNFSTSSDVSSLQGCGTPDSPPQATSPTGEFRDLLDKIQQLPGHRESNRSLDFDNFSPYHRRYYEDEVPSCSVDESLIEGTSTSANYSAHNDNVTETNEESLLLTDSLLSDVDLDSSSKATKPPKNLIPVRPNKLIFKRNFPSRSKTFYMPFCHNSSAKKKKANNGNFSFSAPVTPVTGFPSPSSIAVNFLANPRKLGSRRSLERNVDDNSPLLQEENGNGDEIF